MVKEYDKDSWERNEADIFWGEIAPCDHVVQIYERDDVFLDTLAGYVGSGINAGDCCIVIATKEHIEALDDRLTSYGIQIKDLKSENRYIAVGAEETLNKFMRDGWPDETLFIETVTELLIKAKTNNRKVRAFGEMVALLWAEGNCGATVQLEHLWNKFCEKEVFCLFCAYPKTGFTGDIKASIGHICSVHSKVISGSQKQLTEVFYQTTKIKSHPHL
jgi:hypothetical protein